MRTVWIGTFPPAGAGTPAGQGEGLWRASFDGGSLSDLRQVIEAPAPTFLAAHPSGRWLYAGSEQAQGTVTAFEVADDAGEPVLRARATVSSGGADPCHLALATHARALYVANYSSGTLAVIGLDADGAIEGDAPRQVLGFEGTGPDDSRQESSHAHFVAVVPGGADDGSSGDRAPAATTAEEVVVVDLGADVLRHHTVGPDGTLELTTLTHLPPGTGPRHLAVSPDGRWWYVVGELDATLHVLERTADGLVSRQVLSLAGEAERREHGWYTAEGRILTSHVALAGHRLVVGMRRDNRLDEFAVAQDGTLVPVGSVALAGWPRHFAVVGQHVLVAGQTSDAVEIVAPGGARTEVALPAPACIVPV